MDCNIIITIRNEFRKISLWANSEGVLWGRYFLSSDVGKAVSCVSGEEEVSLSAAVSLEAPGFKSVSV